MCRWRSGRDVKPSGAPRRVGAGPITQGRNACIAEPSGPVVCQANMSELVFIKGDATCPQAKGVKLICHICNDSGGWGKGFVLAISRRWKQPERTYREWYNHRGDNGFSLGAVQFVQVEPYIWVANMLAQRGTKRGSKGPPIRYEAVRECLGKVAERATELKASIHMPRIGCGLAGGEWSRIEPLIVESLCRRGLSVTVYDLA
jgi:O-acetyl-ADP-ribose deacetylase (regulator of RNase III)